MKIKTTLTASVAAAAIFAFAAPVVVATPANAGSIENGNGASVTLSGRFNKALTWADNGLSDGVSIGDNNSFRSRAWLTVKSPINEAVTASGRVEYRLGENTNAGVDQVGTGANGPNDGTSDESAVTESWVQLTHKQFGAIKIGLHEVATDGMATQSLSAAGETFTTGAVDSHGNINAIVKGAKTTTATTVADFFANYEGGDEDNITYITPNVAGFRGKGSYSSDGTSAVSLGWGGKMAGFNAKVYAGYANRGANSTTVEENFGGGIAVKHDSGISAAFNYTAEDAKAATQTFDGSAWAAQVGYEAKLTSIGTTGFVFEYMQSEDTDADGDEGKRYAFGVQQNTDSGVTLYGSYQLFEMSTATVSYEDVSATMAGVVVNF